MSDRPDEQPLDLLADELDPREREELAARLALAAGTVEPSRAVRERVMARIAAMPAGGGRRGAPRWRAAAALAAAAALGALLTWSAIRPPVAPEPELAGVEPPAASDADARIEELEAMLAEQDDELLALEGELRAARDALSVLTAEHLERLDLRPAGADAGEAEARVYWDWDEYSCYFVSEGLPAAEGQGGYALWLYTDRGDVLLAGRFSARGAGPASFFAMLPKEMGKVVRAVVTREGAAEAAAEEPTGPVVLEGGKAI